MNTADVHDVFICHKATSAKIHQFPVKNLNICQIDIMSHFRMNCNNFGDHLAVIMCHHQVRVCVCQIILSKDHNDIPLESQE